MRLYRIDLHQAVIDDRYAYPNFNAFFTRALKPGVRPIEADPRVFISPVDGTVSQLGAIDDGRIFQAKGRDYSAAELLGDEGLAEPFAKGGFCTIYLAPHNYHRIHMPVEGTLRDCRLIPGRLFSVNPTTVGAMPRLFARNERVVTMFDTPFGPFALVLIGALFVGSMETVWAGMITPPHRRSGISEHMPLRPPKLPRGAEMGRFNMGSTVILLTPPGAVSWQGGIAAGTVVRMGDRIGWSRGK